MNRRWYDSNEYTQKALTLLKDMDENQRRSLSRDLMTVVKQIKELHEEDEESDVCGCQNRGCLEQYASATGVVRLATRRLAKDDAPSVLRSGEVSAKTVFDAVKAGDAVAIEIAEQFGEYLGKGLAAVAAVVNPEMFVIGGGVSKAGEILTEGLKKHYNQNLISALYDKEFRLATLGNDAGIFGSAKMILDQVTAK